jgi:hypothetical protein
VDVILTNPPFGGEEERGILANFPADRRTSETALLFLQLIMRRLKRRLPVNTPNPRAAVVVPNGFLFGGGVATRLKEELLTDFNLHTIVRLPGGVFAPYTGIPTNILFFDRAGRPTEQVHYFEVQPRAGAGYSKSRPFRFDEFDDCIAWWQTRAPNPSAWVVGADEIRASGFNLDVRNPNQGALEENRPVVVIFQELAARSKELEQVIGQVGSRLSNGAEESEWREVRISDLLEPVSDPIDLLPDEEYSLPTVKRRCGGIDLRETRLGYEIQSKGQSRLVPGAFVISRVQCWHQAFAIAPIDLGPNWIVSSNYDQFVFKNSVDPTFFWWLAQSERFLSTVRASASGVVIEKMVFDRVKWLASTIRIPDLPDQRRIARALADYASVVVTARSLAASSDELLAGMRETLVSVRE